MTDEEKAIEILLAYKNQLKDRKPFNCSFVDMQWAINIILDLIEKQEKEIEELKKKNEPQPDCAESVERTEKMVNMKWVNYNYISKDKIRKFIEEQTHKGTYKFKSISAKRLQELLEEIENGRI